MLILEHVFESIFKFIFGIIFEEILGRIFKFTGALIRWLLNAGREPFETVYKLKYNGLLGFLILTAAICLIIFL